MTKKNIVLSAVVIGALATIGVQKYISSTGASKKESTVEDRWMKDRIEEYRNYMYSRIKLPNTKYSWVISDFINETLDAYCRVHDNVMESGLIDDLGNFLDRMVYQCQLRVDHYAAKERRYREGEEY